MVDANLHMVSADGTAYLNVSRARAADFGRRLGHPNPGNLSRACDEHAGKWAWADGWQGLYHVRFLEHVNDDGHPIEGSLLVLINAEPASFFREVVSRREDIDISQQKLKELLGDGVRVGKGGHGRKSYHNGWRVRRFERPEDALAHLKLGVVPPAFRAQVRATARPRALCTSRAPATPSLAMSARCSDIHCRQSRCVHVDLLINRSIESHATGGASGRSRAVWRSSIPEHTAHARNCAWQATF